MSTTLLESSGSEMHREILKAAQAWGCSSDAGEKWGSVGPSERERAWGTFSGIVSDLCVRLDSPPTQTHPPLDAHLGDLLKAAKEAQKHCEHWSCCGGGEIASTLRHAIEKIEGGAA
jgi:hypothetical protein